jgi:cell division septation protein DedD
MNEENIEEGVTLKKFKSELQAELLVERLQSQGIFAFIKKDDPAAMGLIRGASVIVQKSDKEKALEILRDLDY